MWGSSLYCQSKGKELMGISPSQSGREGQQPKVFEVQPIGDSHVDIKFPHGFSSRRKRPMFEVCVNRYERTLPYEMFEKHLTWEMSKLFDGIYSLTLDRKDAHGLMNITVSSLNPRLCETTEVDFGTPWLKVANWKHAAQVISSQLMKEFDIAQANLSGNYGRFASEFQQLMSDVTKRSHVLRHEIKDLKDRLNDMKWENMKYLERAQSFVRKIDVKMLKDDLWKSIKSPALSRAQDNAQHLQTNLRRKLDLFRQDVIQEYHRHQNARKVRGRRYRLGHKRNQKRNQKRNPKGNPKGRKNHKG